jgi:protein phosphatase
MKELKVPDPLIIQIPSNALVALCGPAACGKSTFARKHFKRTEIVSTDHCRAMIFDDEKNQSVSGHAFELFYFIIEKRLRLARLAVADSTALAPEARKELLRLARAHGRSAHVIAFDAPVETLLERDKRRRRKVGEEVIRKQAEKFAPVLERLPQEGFDAVWRLDEKTADSATLELM